MSPHEDERRDVRREEGPYGSLRVCSGSRDGCRERHGLFGARGVSSRRSSTRTTSTRCLLAGCVAEGRSAPRLRRARAVHGLRRRAAAPLAQRCRRARGRLADGAAAVVTVSDEIADGSLGGATGSRPARGRPQCPPRRTEAVDRTRRPLRVIYQAAAGPGRNLADLPDVAGVESPYGSSSDSATLPPYHACATGRPRTSSFARSRPSTSVLVIDRPKPTTRGSRSRTSSSST